MSIHHQDSNQQQQQQQHQSITHQSQEKQNFSNNNIDYFDNNSSSSNITIIKLEPISPTSVNNNINMDSLSNNPFLTTASVPIPTRCGNNNNNNNNNGSLTNNNNLSGNNNINNVGITNNPRNIPDLSDFVFDFDQHSQSPHMLQDISFITNSSSSNNQNLYENQNSSSGLNWNDYGSQTMTLMAMTKVEPFHMDEDDIFQVDKADLIQGPTLAELNAENLYVDLLNIEDLLLPEEMGQESQLHQLQTSPNLSGGSAGSNDTIQTSPMLPQQLFQSHTMHLGSSGGNSQNSNSGGILITGQDLLYDDHTNTSSSPYDNYQSPSAGRSHNSTAAFSPGSHGSNSSLLLNSITPPPQHHQSHQQTPTYCRNKSSPGMVQHNPKYSTLHELLLKKDYSMSPDRNVMLGQSVPGPSSLMISGQALSPGGFSNRKLLSHFQSGGSSSGAGSSSSRLSSSAPTHLGLEQIWQRREPRPHLLSTGSLAEAGSTSSISTGVLSPEAPDFSHDEGYSEDDDSDHYEDFSSDNGII